MVTPRTDRHSVSGGTGGNALYNRPEWQERGACREWPLALFFPEHGCDPAAIRHALRICGTCEVRTVCLRYALEHKIDHGIWGGATAVARRNMRRAAPAIAPW